MPQGVEHLVENTGAWFRSQVPTSVMPQGVEHKRTRRGGPATMCVPTSVMPQGVEHGSLAAQMAVEVKCRLQCCRRALSTGIHRLPVRHAGVPTSVMPQGVEHRISSEL